VTAKKVTPKKKTIKKPVAEKKGAKKTTSELMKAIKARDIETNTTDVSPKAAAAAKKSSPAKTAAKARAKKRKLLPIVPPMQKAVEIVVSSTREKKKRNRPSFNKKDLAMFRNDLLKMRDHFTGQTFAMKHDALQRDDEVNPEEDGTDAFMRLQALNQMNDQQHIVSDIDMALASIEKGTYGSCEMCECLISKLRLKARPFAKFCVKCKSEMERSIRFNKPR
jgi:DnaK suppressor protein